MNPNTLRKNHSKPVKRSAADRFFIRHTHAALWLSGLIPVLGLLIIYAWIGIAPFGDKSVAHVDMMQQYIPFYASLKNALLEGHGLGYSQSLGMGGSYWGLIGYYLTSPFAVCSLLVPNEWLTDYMALQELVRVGLTGCSFGFFYSRKFSRNDLSVVLLSMCYALSSFMLIHLCTVIWGGCLTLLPLVVWGLEELLRGKKPWVYVLCLSLAGISNYYFALMTGIYLVLYTAAFLCAEGLLSDRTAALRKIAMFAAGTLLSVGIAAGILLPSALLLAESSAGESGGSGGWLTMNPLRLLSQMLYGLDFHILSQNGSFPLLYCSVFAVTLLPAFFLCRGISKRTKAAFGSLAGIILLSLAVSPLNYLWHGAHEPNDLPYRFTFLLIFTLLIMAGYALSVFETITQNTFNASLFTVMASASVIYFSGIESMTMLAVTVLAGACYIVLFYLRSGGRIASGAVSLLVTVLAFVELVSGGVLGWKALGEESAYIPRAEYISHYRRINSAADMIAVSDSDVFRVSPIAGGIINDGTLTGQSSLSFFSSTVNSRLMKLFDRMGYNTDLKGVYYHKSFTPLADSMMNMKYVIYNKDVGEPPYLQRTGSADGYCIYRNTLALGRAFAVSEAMTGWNTDQINPFDVQNDLLRRAVSDSDMTAYESMRLSADGEMTSGGASADGRVNIPPSGRIVLSGIAPERRHLYAFTDCKGAASIHWQTGERSYHLPDVDSYVTDLGWIEAGETFTVSVTAGENAVEGFISAAFLNEKALEKGIAALKRRCAEMTVSDDNRVTCDITARKNEILFTSIPYEKGWNVTVNGRKTRSLAIGGGLIGVPLTEGANTVELQYTVRGRTAGLLISLVSIVAAVWLLFGRETASLARTLRQKHWPAVR